MSREYLLSRRMTSRTQAGDKRAAPGGAGARHNRGLNLTA